MAKLITFESVGMGHPDKICDQISDKILDAYLAVDPDAKVACETMAANKLIVIGGEITSKAEINRKQQAIEILKLLRYNPDDFTIIDNVNKQSPDINQAVVGENVINAGDQGIVYGFATNESENAMPVGFNIANKILANLTKIAFTENAIKFDMKSQVTMIYDDNDKLTGIDTVLVSCQHDENQEQQAKEIIRNEIKKVLELYDFNTEKTKIIINPSGRFVIGGPVGDTGLTGRKIIVDTYGGIARHGGGAFSGKDPSKVDRTGAYYARFLAKNIVNNNFADKCEIQLAFAIGKPAPVAMYIETFGTEKTTKENITSWLIHKGYIWNVSEMIKNLELQEPKFFKTAVFGHFGKKSDSFIWEKINIAIKN